MVAASTSPTVTRKQHSDGGAVVFQFASIQGTSYDYSVQPRFKLGSVHFDLLGSHSFPQVDWSRGQFWFSPVQF
ncbi:hypothetical protein Hdeb2414_s0006g00224731 [Helianthus debilis subsp. tardiflorus]